MKLKIAILAALLAALGARAEVLDSTLPEANSTDHGLTLTTNATDGLVVWTNTAKVPIRLNSVIFDFAALTTNAAAVTLLRRYDVEYVRKASEVITNEFGDIVTNVFNQITNVVASLSSNTMASASIVGDGWFGINHLTAANRLPEGFYSRKGDVFIIQAGTSTAPVIVDFSE